MLPVFLTQILGASGAVVGLIEGVATATQNIVQGLSGAGFSVLGLIALFLLMPADHRGPAA